MTEGERSRAGEADESRLSGKILWAFESPEQIIMVIAFLTAFGAISWGVLSRYVVPTPATWVEEITFISFGWLIFVGAAEVHRRAQHVSVDLLTSLLPPPVQRALGLVMDFGVICFCLYIAYLGVKQTIVMHSSHTSMLRIPMSVGYVGFTLGFFLMGVRGLQRLVRRLRGPESP
jgi:TRAP-type C4-dicarboxylate transport system permease small subunit